MQAPTLKQVRLDKLNLPEPSARTRRRGLGRLAASIAEVGLIVPLLIRPLGRGEYAVIAGEGRVRAERERGRRASHRIPCLIIDVDDERAALLALVENAVREPLAPFDEARLIRILVADYDYTQERVAHALGTTQTRVSRALAIFDLDRRVVSALRAGKIEMEHVRALLSLRDDRAAQRRILAKVLGQSLDGARTAALVNAHLLGRGAIPPVRFTVRDAGTVDARTTRSGRIRITLEANDRGSIARLLDAVRRKYV